MTKRFSVKALITAASVALLVLLGVAVTLAYIVAKTPPTDNEVSPPVVFCEVTGNLDADEKTDIAVKNTGDVESYVRAMIVINWVLESDGSIYAPQPILGTDYSIDFGTSSHWRLGADGFYYYLLPIGAQETTELLVASVSEIAEAPSGCKLSVSVIAQSVQSTPSDAVESLWGVTVLDNGNISVE